jgi:hypothetical protein
VNNVPFTVKIFPNTDPDPTVHTFPVFYARENAKKHAQ